MIHYITQNGVEDAWVGNELRTVMRSGIPVALHSLRPTYQTFFTSEDVEAINRSTRVLYPVSYWAVLGAVFKAPFRFGGRFLAALANALFGRRESIAVRVKCLWHFMLACKWAGDVKGERVDLIHSQWIHSNGTVAMYGAWLLGVPFSFTGHAADLFRNRCALRDKIKRAAYIICISQFHRNFYMIYGARPEQLKIGYCGIDVEQFSYRPPGERGEAPFTILSSGRLVEKKGFSYLIDACELLSGRIDYKCVIAGSGELQEALNRQVEALGLEERIVVTGEPLMQTEITEFMHSGDCYCLPCVWAADNDVDGLPQMLMEAMACGLPVVSTRLVGIPDLVIDHDTGILIEPNDAGAIADALEEIYLHPDLGRELATSGRALVEDKFNLKTCVEPLINEFRMRVSQ